MATTTPTVPTPRQLGGLKRTKRYRALRAALKLSEQEALTRMLGDEVAALLFAPATEATPEDDKAIAGLIAEGHSAEEADKLVQGSNAPAAPAKTLTPKQRADLLVQERGLTFARGLVRLPKEVIEAAVRVGKTGTPEIVQVPDPIGYVTAAELYREDSGIVACQNLADMKVT